MRILAYKGGFRAEAASITYIDADGTEKTANATAINSSTTTLTAGWYYVTGTVNINNTITLNGTEGVHLILTDNCQLTAANEIKGNNNSSLHVYGQSAGTGRLSSSAPIYNFKKLTINGGTVYVTSTSGKAYIGNDSSSGGGMNVNVTISGGQVTVTGTGNQSCGIICGSSGSITLGCTNADDFIQPSHYLNNSGYRKDPTIADGKIIFIIEGDTTTQFSGTLTQDQTQSIKGKKLVPVQRTVKFNANNGTGTMNDQKFAHGSSQALTANTFTPPASYTFNGWNTKADGSGTSYSDGAAIAITEDLTLYAQWKAIEYTITYELNGGSAANPTSYTIETATFTLTNPTKNNYTFTGWTGTGLDSLTETVTIPKGSTGNRTYTANYTENQSSAAVLESLSVSITGSDTLTTTAGESLTSTYTASVTGTYSDGSSKTLEADDYSLAWTLDKNISGVSITDGKLSVNNSVSAGKYNGIRN